MLFYIAHTGRRLPSSPRRRFIDISECSHHLNIKISTITIKQTLFNDNVFWRDIWYFIASNQSRISCWAILSISISSKLWKQRTVDDVTQLCVRCGRGAQTWNTKSVGRGRHCCCWVTDLPWRGLDNESRVFTASMLTVIRPFVLTVALAAGLARVTGLGVSIAYSTFFFP